MTFLSNCFSPYSHRHVLLHSFLSFVHIMKLFLSDAYWIVTLSFSFIVSILLFTIILFQCHTLSFSPDLSILIPFHFRAMYSLSHSFLLFVLIIKLFLSHSSLTITTSLSHSLSPFFYLPSFSFIVTLSLSCLISLFLYLFILGQCILFLIHFSRSFT